MSETTDLRARIARLFSDRLNRDVPSADTDLFESGILDSLAFVDLLVHLEQDFGTRIALDDLEVDNFRSIARIADYTARASTAERSSSVNFSTGSLNGNTESGTRNAAPHVLTE